LSLDCALALSLAFSAADFSGAADCATAAAETAANAPAINVASSLFI
jgi:hypothetical protein